MIFFDIDGTLIDHVSASAQASLVFYDQFPGRIAFSREEFPTAWEEIMQKHFDRFSRGEISLWEQRRARIREVFAAPDLPQDETDRRYRIFIREYDMLTRAFEDVAPCVQALAGRQPLGIISNGPREGQLGKLERAGLLQYFPVVVCSEDVGLGKPAPKIFLEACRRAGVEPQSCVYIGDNIDSDILPSRALGMRGIHLCRNGGPQAAPPVFASLRDLPAAIF